MGRLVDIGAVCKTIKEEWDGCSGRYAAKDIIDFTIFDVEQMEGTEAIPISWIEAEIKKLRDMDNGFASFSAGQIEAMLKKWREEQNDKRESDRTC